MVLWKCFNVFKFTICENTCYNKKSVTFNRRGSGSLHLRDEMAGLSFVIADVFDDSPGKNIE